jgi:hypothetical protein
MKDISENREQLTEDYAQYKNSLYYQLKTKCAKTTRTTNAFKEDVFNTNSDFTDLTSEIEAYSKRIQELQLR